MRRKQSADEIARRTGLSERHCRRLITDDDERCYVATTRPAISPLHPLSPPFEPHKFEALEVIRAVSKLRIEAHLKLWNIATDPDRFFGIPSNFDTIADYLKRPLEHDDRELEKLISAMRDV
jgi:hypothetical protein